MSDDQYAGTAELVGILASIARARLQFPDNSRIKALSDAAAQISDSDLFQAVLLQLSAAQQEMSQQRESPMAQLLKQQMK